MSEDRRSEGTTEEPDSLSAAGLRLSNRLSRLTTILHERIHNDHWRHDQEPPGDGRRDWIARELEKRHGNDYRREQAKLLGQCLASAFVSLERIAGTIREAYNRRAPEETAEVGHSPNVPRKSVGPATEETAEVDRPSNWDEADRGRHDKPVNLQTLLPALVDQDDAVSFETDVPHFGSVTFHSRHKTGTAAAADTPESLAKVSFGEFPKDAFPLSVLDAIRNWLAKAANGICSHYSCQFKALGKTKQESFRKAINVDNPQVLFQDCVSELLEAKQSMFLGGIGAQTPLVLLSQEPVSAAGRQGPSLTPKSKLSLGKLGDVQSDICEFLSQWQRCELCSPPAAQADQQAHCPVKEECQRRLGRLRESLGAFLWWYRSEGTDTPAWVKGIWSKSAGRYPCRHLIEFLVPFACFNYPVLISAARFLPRGESEEPGAVSMSVAMSPSASQTSAGAWTDIVAAALQRLVNELGTAISAIDHEVQVKRAKHHSLRSTVSGVLGRAMAHDVGSHMLARAQLPAEGGRFFFEHLKEYLRQRMVFLAEATTSDPLWEQPLPLLHVIDKFAGYAKERETKAPSAAIQYLAGDGVLEKDVDVTVTEPLSKELHVSFPGGLVGTQALYCILENVIRNAAKHGKSPENGAKMKVHVKVVEEGEGQVAVCIWDTWSRYSEAAWERVRKYYGYGSDHTENVWRFVDEEGRPTIGQGGLGIKEVRIAAAWLSGGRPLVALLGEEDEQHTKLAWPICVDENQGIVDVASMGQDRRVYMGVQFLMRTAKELLVVTDEIEPDSGRKRELAGQGIGVYSAFETAIENGWGSARILWVGLRCGSDEWGSWKRCRHQLPLPAVVRQRGMMGGCLDCGEVTEEEWKGAVGAIEKGDASRAVLLTAKRWLKKRLWAGRCGNELPTVWLGFGGQSPPAAWCSNGEWGLKAVGRDTDDRGRPDGDLYGFDYHHMMRDAWGNGAQTADDEWAFREDYGSLSMARHVLRNPPSGLALERTRFELLFAACTDFVILDERLAHVPDGENEKEVRMAAERRIRIYVVRPGTMDELDAVYGNCADPQVLFVHQGLLDSQFGKRGEAEDWVEKVRRTCFKVVVVMSDRGQESLEKLPANARFLPYSIVEGAVVGGSKLLLTQALLSARSVRARRGGADV